MSYEMLNNNKVYLQGEVADVPKYNHTVLDENFYSFNLIVPRLSGQNDILPITISSKLIDENQLNVGDKIALRGQFRSYNKLEEGKSKLLLSVFCRELCEWDNSANSNVIEYSMYSVGQECTICK